MRYFLYLVTECHRTNVTLFIVLQSDMAQQKIGNTCGRNLKIQIMP
jgi:hypothetical protein